MPKNARGEIASPELFPAHHRHQRQPHTALYGSSRRCPARPHFRRCLNAPSAAHLGVSTAHKFLFSPVWATRCGVGQIASGQPSTSYTKTGALPCFRSSKPKSQTHRALPRTGAKLQTPGISPFGVTSYPSSTGCNFSGAKNGPGQWRRRRCVGLMRREAHRSHSSLSPKMYIYIAGCNRGHRLITRQLTNSLCLHLRN